MSNEHLYKRGEIWWMRATANGREYRASLRTSHLPTARRLRDKRLAEITAAAYHGEVKHTWEEAVTEWATHAIGQISRSTSKRYAVSLKQIHPALSGRSISSITGVEIQALIQQRRRDGATPATVRRDLTAISRVLEYAEALGWREGNPTLSKRKLLRERRDPIELPTSQSITAMIQASSTRFGALIFAALMTGCRQDELVNLTWKQFNAKTGTLEVIGKGNKRRTIQLSEDATRHIDGTVRVLGSDLIFCTPQGTKWSSPASYFVKIRNRVMERNKLLRRVSVSTTIRSLDDDPSEPTATKVPLPDAFRPFRFHDLRHLWAVNALRGGMGLYALSKHLGHTSVSVTERVYLAFLTPEEAEAAKAKAA
jgi:integrase/recombinase XerD